MFTGKMIALAVALLITLAGIAGYFVTRMQAADVLEQAKWDDDARYKKQLQDDRAAWPSMHPQSRAK